MVWRSFIMGVLLSVSVVTGHPVILGWNLRPHLRFSTPGYTWETTAGSGSFSPVHTVHSTHTQRAARGLGKPRFMEKHSRQGLPAVYLPHTHHLHQYPHTLNEAYFPKPPHIAHLCTCVMSLHFISRTAMERHQPPSCMSVWRCVFVSDSKVSSQLMANTTANRTPIHTKWFILETQLQHNSVNLL